MHMGTERRRRREEEKARRKERNRRAPKPRSPYVKNPHKGDSDAELRAASSDSQPVNPGVTPEQPDAGPDVDDRSPVQDPWELPITKRPTVVPGKDIPATLDDIYEAMMRGEVVQFDSALYDDIYTPEVNARLDAIDPTIRDFSSLTSPEALAYSEQARIVVRTYLNELQSYYREFRRGADLGQPLIAIIFDLRHEFARNSAFKFYPQRKEVLSGLYEGSQSAPGTIPAFWEVRPMPDNFVCTPMPGLYPVVVFGPTCVVIQIPIPD
jgi:hypothetical protein